jgi:hypothetical protein
MTVLWVRCDSHHVGWLSIEGDRQVGNQIPPPEARQKGQLSATSRVPLRKGIEVVEVITQILRRVPILIDAVGSAPTDLCMPVDNYGNVYRSNQGSWSAWLQNRLDARNCQLPLRTECISCPTAS